MILFIQMSGSGVNFDSPDLLVARLSRPAAR